jgi:hypothetical protein
MYASPFSLTIAERIDISRSRAGIVQRFAGARRVRSAAPESAIITERLRSS